MSCIQTSAPTTNATNTPENLQNFSKNMINKDIPHFRFHLPLNQAEKTKNPSMKSYLILP